MLETLFPFLYAKIRVKSRYLELGTKKTTQQFWPVFRWKSTFSGRPCFVTSLWRHTWTDVHDFGINGKRRPSLLYHNLGVSISSLQGVGNHPNQEDVLQKRLRKTGLIRFIDKTLMIWSQQVRYYNRSLDSKDFRLINSARKKSFKLVGADIFDIAVSP